MDKDAFMKLLLTQMKNQDPTSPMQSHEMAAQLAQFTSLEQLQNINQGIEGLAKAQAPSQNFESLNLIGKSVRGDASRIDRGSEQDEHGISFEIPSDAMRAEIKIKDETGAVVRTIQTSRLKGGKNEITWNGANDDGRMLPVGTYSASIEAYGTNGGKLFVDTKFDGIISGVQFTAQGPLLMLGKRSIPLREVKEITDPQIGQPTLLQRLQAQGAANGAAPASATNASGAAQAAPTNAAQAPAAAKVSGPSKPESKPNRADIPVGSSNLDNVGMSRGLINQLGRETGRQGNT
jgi:flagellar hook assembly protein FlgD